MSNEIVMKKLVLFSNDGAFFTTAHSKNAVFVAFPLKRGQSEFLQRLIWFWVTKQYSRQALINTLNSGGIETTTTHNPLKK